MDDYEIAFTLGKIAGGAETIADEYPRDTIYSAAVALLEDLRWKREQAQGAFRTDEED